MTLVPLFDSSVTSNKNAAFIESAVKKVSAEMSSAFTNPATVRFNVSWGSVQGSAIPSGDISSSIENLSGPYSFATLSGDIRAAAAANPRNAVLQSVASHLPKTNPAGALSYRVPYGEAQALGLLPPRMGLAAGGIGFNSAVNWDFDPINGVASTSYDLEGAATHEIEEVLGRISGLESTRPTLATPLDLFRYSAVGVSSFSYTAASYFSIDGGKTGLEYFNVAGGGDRSDIASAGGLTDVQAAYVPKGVALTLSAADLTMLDALGWGGFAAPRVGGAIDPLYDGSIQAFGGAVPEPGAWILLLAGFTAVGFASRSRPGSRAEQGALSA